MKCFKCGTEIPAGKIACEKCGAIAFTGQDMSGNVEGNNANMQRNHISMYNSSANTGSIAGSVASLVLGIVSLLLLFETGELIGIPAGIIGVALGGYALYQKKPGRKMAIAGLVCSIVVLCLWVVRLLLAWFGLL